MKVYIGQLSIFKLINDRIDLFNKQNPINFNIEKEPTFDYDFPNAGNEKPNKGVRRQAIREQRKQMLKRNK